MAGAQGWNLKAGTEAELTEMLLMNLHHLIFLCKPQGPDQSQWAEPLPINQLTRNAPLTM